jgi:hypothetical protein
MMFANIHTKVLVYLGKPNSSAQNHATEKPEEPGKSAAGNHWLHVPAKSGQRRFAASSTKTICEKHR